MNYRAIGTSVDDGGPQRTQFAVGTGQSTVNIHNGAQGQAAAAKVPHVLASVNNDFLAGFSESEWRQLGKLLGRMESNGQALQSAKADVEAST